jgi:hypothetical protein
MKRFVTSIVGAAALVLILASATPGQATEATIPARISVAEKDGVNADNLKIEAWFELAQGRSHLDLGGDSPAEFRQKLAKFAAGGARGQYPAPPNVNLTLVLKNSGMETFSFIEPGPQAPLDIALDGRGAIKCGQAQSDHEPRAPRLAPMFSGGRNTFMRPNESARIPIRSLRCLPGGAPSYWTEPGDYILRISFVTSLEDMYGRIKWRGVTIESNPIKLIVEAPAEATTRRIGAPIAPSLAPAAAGLRDVEPQNWKATASKLRQRITEVNALYNETNPRARDARLEAIQEYLDRFIGTQVEWSFPLDFRVAEPEALLQPSQPPFQKKLAAVPTVAWGHIRVQMTSERGIPGVQEEGFNPILHFKGTLPMLMEGKDIPNNVFLTLKQGDPITVRGKIERICVFQFFNPPPSIIVLLSNVTLELGGQLGPLGGPAGRVDDSFDAVELNGQLAGNEIRASEFKNKLIEVRGLYYGSEIIRPANGVPSEAYLVTFKAYAGLGECTHIKCFFFKKADLVGLKPGDPLKVRGKVSAFRDVVGIEANLVK